MKFFIAVVLFEVSAKYALAITINYSRCVVLIIIGYLVLSLWFQELKLSKHLG